MSEHGRGDRRDGELDELLGAYALDAVDGDERARIEAYLAADPQARDEVARHREVAALLAIGTERPPDGLWDRIAGALEEPAPAPGPRLAQVMPIEPAARRRRGLLGGIAAAAVAAAAAVIVTVAVVGDDDGGSGEAAMADAYADALAAPEGRRTELVADDQTFSADAVLLPNGTGYLSAADLPELPDTETWQLWGVYGDEDVISLGVLGNRPDLQAFTAHDDIEALVITREQAGGVPQSTSGAVLVGPLG
jgi:anti-sigma-K factor RskA